MKPVPVSLGNPIAMLVFCCVCFNASSIQAQCIDTTANATVSASVAANGSIYSFNNTINALTNDGNWANAASLLQLFGDKLTDELQVKGFGFNIPTAASICGIQVRVVRSTSSLDLLHLANIKDYQAQLMKGGTPVGDDQAKTTTEWPESDGNAIYGNSSDLWNVAWTPADINSSNFGFSISAKIHALATLFPVAKINYISITVSYLPPTLLPEQSLQFLVANGANHSAALSWKPDAAVEGATFAVERSANGSKWQPLQSLPKQNFTTSVFTFTDAQPLPGKSYYRLKVTVPSGEVRYSSIQPFELIDNLVLKCYPNPVTTTLLVTGVIPGDRVELTDLYGKRLFQSLPATNNTIQLDMAHLQPGIYVISTGNQKMKIAKK